jgi:hypothetical protein
MASSVGRYYDELHKVNCRKELGENVNEMYAALGDWFKNELKGYECWVISSNEEAFKNVGLKPDKKYKLYNGDLECSFRKYTIFEGFRKAVLSENNGETEVLNELT